MKEFKEDLIRIENKVDKLDERQDRMELILVQNTQILDEHQRRSLALENYVEHLEKRLHAEISPVNKHIITVRATFKVLVWLGGAVAATLGTLVTLQQLGII